MRVLAYAKPPLNNPNLPLACVMYVTLLTHCAKSATQPNTDIRSHSLVPAPTPPFNCLLFNEVLYIPFCSLLVPLAKVPSICYPSPRDDATTTMAPFDGEPSYSQQVALAIVPKITGSLSIMGSSYIIFDCVRGLRSGKRDRNTYRRLMVGISVVDITMSICFFLSTWPMPRGTPFTYGARGNTQTCTAQGFFAQIGVSSVMYTVSLSTYYLLVIRYGWPESRIVKVEPFLHAIPLVFGFATMIAGLPLQLYNYGLWDCWIAPYPQGCEESWRNGGETTCERGDNASLYQIVSLFTKL